MSTTRVGDGVGLPQDILLGVLDFLPVSDLFGNCTRVCKEWRACVTDLTFLAYLNVREGLLGPGEEAAKYMYALRLAHNIAQSIYVERTLGKHERVYRMAYRPDGLQLLTLGDDRTPFGLWLGKWDVTNNDSSPSWERFADFPQMCERAAHRRDGQLTAIGLIYDENHRVVRICNTQSGEELARLVVNVEDIHKVIFSPDGKYIAATVQKPGVNVHIMVITLPEDLAVVPEPNGDDLEDPPIVPPEELAVVPEPNEDDLPITPHRCFFPENASDVYRSIAFSEDGSKLLTASSIGNTIEVWDLGTGQLLRCARVDVTSAAFQSRGTQIVFGSSNGSLGILDIATGKVRTTAPSSMTAVCRVVERPDGLQIAAAFKDGAIKIFDFRPVEHGTPAFRSTWPRPPVDEDDEKRVCAPSDARRDEHIPNMVQESVNGHAGASDLQQATPVAKQTMCEHMVDAASCKGEDAGDASSRFLNHVRYMYDGLNVRTEYIDLALGQGEPVSRL